MTRAATCYPFIEAEKQGDHNVKRACELLGISRSAYYTDRAGRPSPRAQRDAELTGKIIQIHDDSKHTYGAPRVHYELHAQASGAPANGSPGLCARPTGAAEPPDGGRRPPLQTTQPRPGRT